MKYYLFGVQVTHNTFHEILCASNGSIEDAKEDVIRKYPDYSIVSEEEVEAPSGLEALGFIVNRVQIVSDKLGEYMEKRYLNNYNMF